MTHVEVLRLVKSGQVKPEQCLVSLLTPVKWKTYLEWMDNQNGYIHVQDRRVSDRVPLRAKIRWMTHLGYDQGLVTDINETGISFSFKKYGDHNILKQTEIELIPIVECEIQPFKVQVEYVRNLKNENGIAMKFLNLSPQTQGEIKKYISRVLKVV